MSDLTHFDKDGKAVMVDVSAKDVTERTAVASGSITMSAETLKLIKSGSATKGDVLGTARIAAIMAAKKTSDLIPLCHPLPISKVSIDFALDEKRSAVEIKAIVKVSGKTGVEMEALTAVSVAGLTIYDMVKAADKEMVISDIKLVQKEGGKSGSYRRSNKATTSTYEQKARLAKPTEVPLSSTASSGSPPHPAPRSDALRAFMTAKRIKPLRWAQDAGIEPGRLYGFLQGTVSRLSNEEEERLASTVNVSVEALYPNGST